MARLVGRELINCGDGGEEEVQEVQGQEEEELTRRKLQQQQQSSTDLASHRNYHQRRRQQRQQQQQHRHLLVDGVDPAPPDVVTDAPCTQFTSANENTPPNTNCYVVRGLMTLYLREDSVLSSASESSEKALKALMTSMNEQTPSPFLPQEEGNNDNERLGVVGLEGVAYLRGTPDDGGLDAVGFDDGATTADVPRGNIDGAKSNLAANDNGNDGDNADDSLSAVGIAFIALGAVGVVALALVAARAAVRKREAEPTVLPYAEFYDDENDLDMKHHHGGEYSGEDTDVDAASLGGTPYSTKKSRRAYERNDHDDEEDGEGREDDSIFSGLNSLHPKTTRSTRNAATTTTSPGGRSDTDPTYVHTVDDNMSAAMTAEKGYELSYNGEVVIPPPVDEGGRIRTTYDREEALPTYTPKFDVESPPRYENPAQMSSEERSGRERYYVGDTVEF